MSNEFINDNLDAAAFCERITAVLGITASEGFGDQEGIQRRNRDGVPEWALELVWQPEYGNKVVRTVLFNHPTPPDIVPGVMPVLTGLAKADRANVNQYGKLRTSERLTAVAVRFGNPEPRRTNNGQPERAGAGS